MPSIPPSSLEIYYSSYDQLFVRWAPLVIPEELEGYKLKYYMVERNSREVKNSHVTEIDLVPAVLSHALLKLESNTRYKILLFGVNRFGMGPSTSIIAG